MAFKLAGSLAMREALEQAEPGAARADHAASRCPCPRTSVGDVIGDLNSPARAPAGHGAGRRHDRDQGRGADGRDAHLRARPALDHAAARATTRWSSCATRRCPAHLAQKVVAGRRKERRGRPPEHAGAAAPAAYPRRRWTPARSRRCTSRRRVRRLRAHAAARRARPTCSCTAAGACRVRAVHAARGARGLDPRGRRHAPDRVTRGWRAPRLGSLAARAPAAARRPGEAASCSCRRGSAEASLEAIEEPGARARSRTHPRADAPVDVRSPTTSRRRTARTAASTRSRRTPT